MCRHQLKNLKKAERKFQELGARIVAISVDGVETNAVLARRLGLDFPLLSDKEAALIKYFGILDSGGWSSKIHRKRGVSKPAVVLLDSKGVIKRKWTGKHFMDRPRIEELLAVLKQL